MSEWPPFTRPFRASPPEGAVGIVLPIRNDLRFFKLAYHALLSFTDYRFMLTVVDVESALPTLQYLESIRRNHHINVLQYQKEHNLGAEWNLGLRFMFSFAAVKYGLVMTPTVVVGPHWLSGLVRSLDTAEQAGVVTPASNGDTDEALLFRRSLYEELGGFDETRIEPDAFLAKTIDAGLHVPKVGSVYVHKFKSNGFDPRSEDVLAREKQEATQ